MLSSSCEGRQEGRKRVSKRKEILAAEQVNEYKDVHDVSAGSIFIVKSLRESVSISASVVYRYF